MIRFSETNSSWRGRDRWEKFDFFHNSRLIRRIQQKTIYKKLDLTRGWTWVTCLAVRHFNHYTRMFSVLVWGCNWILFMHGCFCPIRLIHLIAQNFLHFEEPSFKLTDWTKKSLLAWWYFTYFAFLLNIVLCT